MFSNAMKTRSARASMAVALTLGAAAIAAVIAGSAAVSAQASDSAAASSATAQLASIAMSPRPLTIRGAAEKPARNVRVIQLYNIPADQKTFGQR